MYQETQFFRKTIDLLIELSLSRGYSNVSFQIGNFEIKVNTMEECTIDKLGAYLEKYLLLNLKDNTKYVLFGYRIKGQSFIVIELNKWTKNEYIFLLNREVNTLPGIKILREIRDIVSQLKSQQFDTTPVA